MAAAVILNHQDLPSELRDSKKLSEKKRTRIAAEIRAKALGVGVGIVHEQDIDRSNILKATFEAMRMAVRDLGSTVHEVQVDGKFIIPGLGITQKALVGGDDLVPEISAASIIAKTTRDAMMISYDVLFPDYGFKSHKGYGAAKHFAALREFGRSPIHRRSFHPLETTPNLRYKYRGNEKAYGFMGEIIAGMWLVRNGYALKQHSYHGGRQGEIDLIATRGDEIIFVEVKSFADAGDDTLALERVTPVKQSQIAKLAEYYLQHHEISETECRFDIITVNFHGSKPRIEHYADAYLPL